MKNKNIIFGLLASSYLLTQNSNIEVHAEERARKSNNTKKAKNNNIKIGDILYYISYDNIYKIEERLKKNNLLLWDKILSKLQNINWSGKNNQNLPLLPKNRLNNVIDLELSNYSKKDSYLIKYNLGILFKVEIKKKTILNVIPDSRGNIHNNDLILYIYDNINNGGDSIDFGATGKKESYTFDKEGTYYFYVTTFLDYAICSFTLEFIDMIN